MLKKYSIEFQYLMQKRIDNNWDEGSSIFSALKVAKNVGLLPLELFKDLNGNPYLSESDRLLPYSQYIAKLQAIPESEVQRFMGLCVDKIQGYAQVDVTDPQSIAKAIEESKAGILCRYDVGKEWWTPPIDPLRSPISPISGHAIIMNRYDYIISSYQRLANTWGNWNTTGTAQINWNNYKMTEAWIILKETPEIPPFKFNNNMSIGSRLSPDVIQLQRKLGVLPESGYFGIITMKAVMKFQIANGITPLGLVGPKTLLALNK